MAQQHVMLSYEWAEQELASKICEYLQQKEILVWMDIRSRRTSDNIYEDIAAAVENASCIICFMTPKFQQSDYCKLELQYAKQRKIPIIPLKLAQNWEPFSWLGLITAGLIRLNIYHHDDLKEKLRQLYNRVRVTISNELPLKSSYETKLAQNTDKLSVYPIEATKNKASAAVSKCNYDQMSSAHDSSSHSLSSIQNGQSTGIATSPSGYSCLESWTSTTSGSNDDDPSTWLSSDMSDLEEERDDCNF